MKHFIKTLRSRPLILDPTVRMSAARFDLDRYNASNQARAFDHNQWSSGSRDRHVDLSHC